MKGIQFIRHILDVVLSPPTDHGSAPHNRPGLDDHGTRAPHGDSFLSAPADGGNIQDMDMVDFMALLEDFEFDWEGDRRVLFS